MTAHIYRLNGKEHLRRPRGDPSGPARRLQLTDRVVDILHSLFIHTYLTTKQVHRLVAPDIRQDTITKKLAQMCRRGLVRAPEGQRKDEFFRWSDLYYQITKDGVNRLVAKERVTIDDALMWQKLLQNLSNDFFHDAAVSYTTFSIHVGAIEQGKRFLSKYDVLAHPKCPASTREAKNPMLIPYQVDGKQRFINPDDLCGIDDGTPPPVFLFPEIDTGSESQTVIADKGIAYDLMLKHDLHTRHFGFSEARVLFIPYGELRLENLARTIARVTHQSKTTDLFRLKAVPELALNRRAPLTGHMLSESWKMPVYNKKEETTTLQPTALCD